MTRLAPYLFVLLLGLLGPPLGRADDFAIDLKAQAAKKPEKVEAKYPVPDTKPAPRAVLMIGVNTPITVHWSLRATDKAALVKDALVHFFVVKIEKPDQQEVPKLTKNVIVESALTMDFKAQDKTEGEITFTVSNPGCYLLRLELKSAANKDGRAPFAALDLLVK